MSNLVSILIPCYNAAPHLEQCIESAINQTYENKEIILLDDGSTDNSYDIAIKYPIKVYKQSNQGQCKTRTKLLDFTNGNYIQYLDADDYLDTYKIEYQLNNEHSDVYIDNWKILVNDNIYTKSYPTEDPLTLLILGIKIQTNCFLVKKSIFDTIKWRDTIHQDSFFLLDIVRNKFKILFTKNYSSNYRMNWSDNQITIKNKDYSNKIYENISKQAKILKKQIEYNERTNQR